MNRYKVIKQLGDGTYGSVLKAVNRSTGEVVSNTGQGRKRAFREDKTPKKQRLRRETEKSIGRTVLSRASSPSAARRGSRAIKHRDDIEGWARLPLIGCCSLLPV